MHSLAHLFKSLRPSIPHTASDGDIPAPADADPPDPDVAPGAWHDDDADANPPDPILQLATVSDVSDSPSPDGDDVGSTSDDSADFRTAMVPHIDTTNTTGVTFLPPPPTHAPGARPRPAPPALAKIPAVWTIKDTDLVYSVHDVLGRGGYGVVYRGTWLVDVDVAVKVVTVGEGYDEKVGREGFGVRDLLGARFAQKRPAPTTTADGPHQSFEAEATMWYNTTSPHVLPLLGIVQQNNKLALVSPILENGTVQAYLKTFYSDEPRRRRWRSNW
ncbi:hypothetical protein HDU93_009417 [Gonapodya sp. JEL0774]|nr:hypothetical protein HDU93_009417 [Gonapodya sp. JEL0774]